MMRRLGSLLLVFVFALVTFGASSDASSRFNDIGHKMVCTCSCGQILLECNHVGCPNSSGMIEELRRQIASGATDTSVFNWFVAKYGPTVLAAPIRGGFDNAAWIVPAVVFLVSIFGTAILIRRWRTRAEPAMAEAAPSISDDLRSRIRTETEF